ncbi:hypothetical protein YC2023_108720 [Brassica napus]
MSVAVRQHTQDVRRCPCVSVCVCVCPCVSVSTHRTSVAVHQYTYPNAGPWTQHAGPWTQHAVHTGRLWLSVSRHRTSVCVRQHTQDVYGCSSTHTGRLWLSISTHISTLVLGLSTLTLLVDCSDDSGPCVLSVHYTQDVRGCSSAHTGHPCVSVSTHRTSVAVRVCPCDFGPRGLSVQYTQDFRGRPPANTGRPWVSASTHRTSVGVPQHTQDVRGCLCVYVCVRLCPSAHTGRPWLSISTHIGTLVLGLSTLALPVDCLGDFGPCGLFVQYTQDVRGCPPAHTGRLWLSVAVRQHTQDVCGCPCMSVCVHGCPPAHTGHSWLFVAVRQHTGRSCVSVSTHMTSVCVRQHTQDIRVCPSAHTARPWLSISIHISTLVLGLSTLTLFVDCLGDFSPRGLSVQYTQDVRGTSVAVHQYTYQNAGPWTQHAGPWTQHAGPSRGLQQTQDVRVRLSAHTGRPWLSVSTHKMSVAVHVCLSTHTGRPWLSISTHISTLVLGLSTLNLPVDCSGDFGPRGVSVPYKQDIRGCPPAHTGRPWLSVCVRQYTQDVRGCPSVHISARCTHRTSVGVRQHTQEVFGCLWLSVSTHRTFEAVRVCPCVSACVRQHAHDVRGLHTGRPWVSVSTHRTSVGVRQHTQDVRGCLCVSVSTHRTSVVVHQYTYQHVGPWTQHADPSRGLIGTHISTLVLGLSMLALPVDCLGDFGPRGLSVQYTQDVRECPPAHTRSLWLTHMMSVAVNQYTYQHAAHTGRPWVSVSTHMMSMGVRVCLSAHTGRPWLSISTHISMFVLGLSTLTLLVDCSGDFGPCGLSVQYTQDVRGCPLAHTRHPCVSVSTHRTSVAVCVWPSAHTGRPRLSISTHISTLVLGLSTLTLPVDCSGGFGPRGLSVQYTQDIRGRLPAHTGRPWVSASTHRTSMSVRQHTQDVRGCPCVSVCVRQHTQDVCGCPPVHISALHTGRPGVSASTHRMFVAVCGGLSAHTGRLWRSVYVRVCPRLSASTHRTSVAVCGCSSAHTGRLCVSISTHMTSMCVRQHTQDVRVCPSAHTARPWLSIRIHISTLVLGLSTLTLPVDCLGDFCPHGLSVQYTQDVRGSPHTGHPWLSVSTHRTSVCVRVCPSVHTGRLWLKHRTSVGVRQQTQDVRVRPSADTRRPCASVSTHRTSVAVCVCLCLSVNTHRTFVAVHQDTYQHVGPWTQHAEPSCGLFCTHRTSVGVRQHTQGVCGCPLAHTGRLWLSVCVCVCSSAHTGRSWLSISTHISTLVLGLSTLTLPVDCSGDFGPRGLSVQYTQDVRWCPPVHTGRPWVSASTHRMSVAVRQHTQDVYGCLCVSDSTHRTSVAVHHSVGVRLHTQDVCGCPCVSVSTHRTSMAVRVCPCVFVSTHSTSVAVHQYTYQHAGPWTQHAGPSRGLFG